MGSNSTYHSLLRVTALTLAVVLVFESGILSPLTHEISQNTGKYLASAVGATASVAPTELNTLTAEITERQRDLDAREEALSAREISVGLNTEGESSSDVSTYILSSILFIILVLMVLNYALDFARQRRLQLLEKNESGQRSKSLVSTA